MADPNNKIDDLEIAVTHHERQIQDLSEMLILQGREIARLQIMLSRLEGKLADMELADNGTKGLTPSEQAAADKPPHY